ncbi:hypothetical protein NADFUDRAFT_52121 [Nadsonia fulvescens var. elongata DSM 6958]|uniref:Uncharacterized protein n=1 Tax=Nadsonia fulvescens var. elongata DSM 6958 TaxID=857566 RepID=A0A1E3PGD8_9ASCO|nr:hypothetical protein NADFUDRAFT_52121 [Nadsonia fulvescens var. elongata DSM 6958]
MSLFRRTLSTSSARLNSVITSGTLHHPIPPPSVANMVSAASSPGTTAPVTGAGRRRIGAIKGGILGFLAGTTLTLTLTYSHILDDYKMANTMAVGDVAALRSSIAALERVITSLEEDVKKK